MAFYETVFIVRPDVSSSQVETITKDLTKNISDNAGKVEQTEKWGLRTLAYPMNKNKKGHYVMFQFSGTGETVTELERQCRLHEDILRFMTIRIDEISEIPSPLAADKPAQDKAA